MTNEEAIKLLKDGQLADSEVDAEKFNEAYNMAIKALEQQSCDLDDAREDFIYDVYNTLDFLPTNNEANRIIDSFDRVTSGLEQQPCEDWYDVPSNEMTLEQARQAVKDLRKKLAEYLEQQLCEDAISRKAAILKVARVTWDDGDSCYDFHDKCVDCLDDLPPVTPKEKTGKWIDDMGLGYHVSICSNCNWRGHGDTCLIYKPKYCPNCGARMVSE